MSNSTRKPELARVNPLVEGLKGFDPRTLEVVDLVPLKRGFMDLPDALEAEKEKKVQIYIHESPSTIITELPEKPVVKSEVEVKPKSTRKKAVTRTRKPARSTDTSNSG